MSINLPNATRDYLRSLYNQKLVRNLGWYGMAELAARVTRLVTTIVVARLTSRQDLGCAAIVLTIFELFRVFTNNGIGQAVISASAETLAATCATAHRLVWKICIGLAGCQVMLSGVLILAGNAQAGWMLAALSPIYLIMAPGLVPVYLIQRARRVHVVATISTIQLVTDNLLCGALAFFGMGAWALVLPKLLVSPIWLVGVRSNESWRFDANADQAESRSILRFAIPVLGCELLNTARLNLDNVLVAAVLDLKALGIYYFVFNAGIGLSLSLTTAMCSALFPHLADKNPSRPEMLARFDHALVTAVLPVSAVIALQAVGSLIYVPFVFGARWHDTAPLVAILCASAIARPVADAGCQLLRACRRTGQEFATTSISTFLYLGIFACALPAGLNVAIPVLALTATLLQLGVAASSRLSVGWSQQPFKLIGIG